MKFIRFTEDEDSGLNEQIDEWIEKEKPKIILKMCATTSWRPKDEMQQDTVFVFYE